MLNFKPNESSTAYEIIFDCKDTIKIKGYVTAIPHFEEDEPGEFYKFMKKCFDEIKEICIIDLKECECLNSTSIGNIINLCSKTDKEIVIECYDEFTHGYHMFKHRFEDSNNIKVFLYGD